MAWYFNADTSERTSRFAIQLSNNDEGDNEISLHLYWTNEAFLGGVFSAKLENVIFAPPSCNESGTAQTEKSKSLDLINPDTYLFCSSLTESFAPHVKVQVKFYLHLYWTNEALFHMFFSVIFEFVIFAPSSCNESGITRRQKLDSFDF